MSILSCIEYTRTIKRELGRIARKYAKSISKECPKACILYIELSCCGFCTSIDMSRGTSFIKNYFCLCEFCVATSYTKCEWHIPSIHNRTIPTLYRKIDHYVLSDLNRITILYICYNFHLRKNRTRKRSFERSRTRRKCDIECHITAFCRCHVERFRSDFSLKFTRR